MNTMSRGILARADLYEDLLNLNINKDTLNDVNSHVWGESLELIIHDYLKIIHPRINNKDYIENLIESISEIKDIPKDFYRCIWLLRFEDNIPQEKLNNFIKYYPDDIDVDEQILKDVLCEIITLILRINPINIDLLREYKEKLRNIISRER